MLIVLTARTHLSSNGARSDAYSLRLHEIRQIKAARAAELSGGGKTVRFDKTLVYGGTLGPCDGIPAHGKIQTGYWRGFKDLVRHRGHDPHEILERHAIDPVAFEDPYHHVECAALVNLLEYCSKLLQDPLFGLHLAERQDPEVFGCVTALARAAPTLRKALQSLIDYIPVCVSPECELEMVTTSDVVELRWWTTHAGLGESPQVHYHGLQLIMKTLKMLGRERLRARYATLAFAVDRTEIQSLQDRLACKVNGKATANAIAFPVDILDCPLSTSNRMLFALLDRGLAEVRAASKAGFVEQVEAYVRHALSTRQCSVDDCAEELGTSARTLQKRLTRMGVKFVDIVQAERIKLAKHALLWSAYTLDEVAFQLGYSEQTTFGRAFKRSTGMTPQAFRSAGRCGQLIGPGSLDPRLAAAGEPQQRLAGSTIAAL